LNRLSKADYQWGTKFILPELVAKMGLVSSWIMEETQLETNSVFNPTASWSLLFFYEGKWESENWLLDISNNGQSHPLSWSSHVA